MSQPDPLKVEAIRHQRLRHRLLSDCPEIDEDTLRDTLEGITNLHEMIAAVIRSALVDEALQVGLRTRIEDMRQRFARLEERGAKKRQLALETMCEVGPEKARAARLYRLGPHRHAVPRHSVGGAGSGAYWVPAATQARSAGAASRSQARRRDSQARNSVTRDQLLL